MAFLVVAVGCGGADRGPPVGVSTARWGRQDGQAARAADGGAASASPVPADFRTRMVRVVGRQVSRGHAERFDGTVWANDAARAAWDTAGDMPEGAVLVEDLVARDGDVDRPGGLLVMQKSAGAWRFVSVGPAGEVVDDARVAPCAACHRQAPRDSVFRP